MHQLASDLNYPPFAISRHVDKLSNMPGIRDSSLKRSMLEPFLSRRDQRGLTSSFPRTWRRKRFCLHFPRQIRRRDTSRSRRTRNGGGGCGLCLLSASPPDPMRAYPSQKMPPVFAGGIVISILNGGVRRVRPGRPACLDLDGHPQAQT